MKHNEKLAYLVTNYRMIWLKTRHEVNFELSNYQSLICCCGKLATGLHEAKCRQFNHKVDVETIKRLHHLLPNKI